MQATHVVLKILVNIFKKEKKQVNFKNLAQNIKHSLINIKICNKIFYILCGKFSKSNVVFKLAAHLILFF